MEVFARVVELGSFSRAADRLEMANASVTTIVRNLENHLGVRLLNRTTRSLSLTDDGRAFYERSQRILAEVQETEDSLKQTRVKPQGRLRVDMPTSIGRLYVVPALPRFTAQYPDLKINLTLNDQVTDLVEEAVDLVIRVGTLHDSTLVARKIYDTRLVACASPEFIARFGEPQTPHELGRFSCLGYFALDLGRIRSWRFEKDGESYEQHPDGSFHVNSMEALADAGVAGAGVVYIPDNIASRPIAAGLLKPILHDWCNVTTPVWVAWPQNRHLSAKVRAFADFVTGLVPKQKAASETVAKPLRKHQGRP
jgi:LysR family transcriptional regulator, regulator for bpeEF and oprC